MGSWYFKVFFSTKMYVQKQYFNIFQELVFLNATNQRIYIWTEGSSLKKCSVSFNFYIVIITCCQLVYIVVGWKLHYALTYLDAVLNKCCFEQDAVSSLLPELLLTN